MKSSKKIPRLHNFRATLYFAAGLVIGILAGQLPIIKLAVKDVTPQVEEPISAAELLPKSTKPIHHSCYSMEYDQRNKNASWVYERLTADSLKGNVSRDRCHFREDDRIPAIFRATLQDYRGSGFDRGHLSAAANHTSSLLEMEETFLLSNISPQDPKLNRGYWSKLEMHVRDLTSSYFAVHVFSGPLYLPKQKADGTKWIEYRVIGKNEVSVPTHFFKILLLEKSSGDITYQGYVVPNEPIDSKVPLEKFITTIEKIEKASGIIFHKQNKPQL